jgi:hypothetical protein
MIESQFRKKVKKVKKRHYSQMNRPNCSQNIHPLPPGEYAHRKNTYSSKSEPPPSSSSSPTMNSTTTSSSESSTISSISSDSDPQNMEMSDCARWHTAVHFAVNDPARDSSIAACSPAYACNPSASSVDRLSLLETWSFHHSFFHSQNMRTCRISSSSSMTSSAHRSARALALAHSTRSARGETSQTDDSLI